MTIREIIEKAFERVEQDFNEQYGIKRDKYGERFICHHIPERTREEEIDSFDDDISFLMDEYEDELEEEWDDDKHWYIVEDYKDKVGELYDEYMKKQEEFTKEMEVDENERAVIRSHWATAWQWLNMGRIVFKDAKPRKGHTITYNGNSVGLSPEYYYYYICDTYPPTESNMKMAEKYKEAYISDGSYDGRIWWKDKTIL